MKKLTIKTIAAITLFSLASGAVLLNSCKKNVKDVYPYAPVVLAPDFQVVSVDYAVDNGTLNSASNLSFKVTYKNNEVTKTVYSTVLNFYIDNVFQKSVALGNIASNTTYQTIFDCPAVAGNHDFKFVINVASDGSTIVAETNIANNSQLTSLVIPVKALVVAKTENITTAVATQAITADPAANVTAGLAQTGQVISTTVAPVKTTYTDGTTAVVAAVQNSDGTIDPTKAVVSAAVNPGVKTGQEQQATISLIVESNVAQKEVVFTNGTQKMDYKDGVISFIGLKSAKTFTPCTEPTNFEALFANPAAMKILSDAIGAAIIKDGFLVGLLVDAPRIMIETMIAFGYTQGNVDNPPTFTVEITSSSTCAQTCLNGSWAQPTDYGFKLTFKDDRNTNVLAVESNAQLSTFTKAPGCNVSNIGTYHFKDCGDNQVSYTFSQGQTFITDVNNPCTGNVHN